MDMIKMIGKEIIKLLVFVVQIPLSIVYFVLSFAGAVISGLGWLFGALLFVIALVLCIFQEFDSWRQAASIFVVAAICAVLPQIICIYGCEWILRIKSILADAVL